MNADIPHRAAGAVQQEKISSGQAGSRSSGATESGAPGSESPGSGGNGPLFKRLMQYQKERFPIVQHGPLIAAFTFSASTFSRAARGENGIIPLTHLIAGILTSLCFFFLLRVTDEYKDHEDDSRYRPYRPVPRGLIRLRELSGIAAGLFVVVVIFNLLLMPVMLAPMAVILVYLFFMTREFFRPAWLKAHPLIYMVSHMMIMPLIDLYTTGLDWLVAGTPPPGGVSLFLVVSFFTGVVIEVGRKIRAPEAEETGVETYSVLYGPRKATLLWMGGLFLAYLFSIAAAWSGGFGKSGGLLLAILLLICLCRGMIFVASGRQADAKGIETMSGIWTLGMYLILGVTPLIV